MLCADTHPALGHPEVAAWALGASDAPEAEAFGEHLASCSECQGAVAEFESVARAIERPQLVSRASSPSSAWRAWRLSSAVTSNAASRR